MEGRPFNGKEAIPIESDRMSIPSYETIEFSIDSGVALVKLNRPKRKNAFNTQLYNDIISVLNYTAKNKDIRVLVLTGNGDYYSSGNDLSVFMGVDLSDKEAAAKALGGGKDMLYAFVNAFIYFPKILIGAINGPAIGIAATTLSHCDFLYGSESCTFNTPFVSLAQSPEGCSSVLFPQKMGSLKANELLLLGKKLNAREALQANFLNEVYKDNELLPKVMEIAKKLATSPPESLLESKRLIRSNEVCKQLEAVNKREVDALIERWTSTEFMETIINFMTNKAKSKL